MLVDFQLNQLGGAESAGELGTALVVISDSTDFRDRVRSGTVSNHFCKIRDDYQSGTKLPHSKDYAVLIYAHESFISV